MKNPRFWICFVVVYLLSQVLGYVTHQLWLTPDYQATAEIWRSPAAMQSKMWVMMVSSAVWAFAFTYIFTRGYEGRGLGEGLRYGLVMGLLIALPKAYEDYVVLPIPYSLALKWCLSGMAMSMLLGVVLSLLYRPARS